MSAWIRSVTGRAYHFEPLNAKQLERPSPFLPELRFLKALGVSWWKRPARGSPFVPIAQSTERECPKLQVAGESPAGDTISGGCGSLKNMPASHAGDHRSEAGQGRHFPAHGVRGIADPTDRESVSLGGASPLSPTILVELKPQQTGTRLLIGFGKVATTSGSTIFGLE